MAKGSSSKEAIISKIQEIYPNAFFVDGKELRIPMIEDGAEVQIKVALTCAKENIEHGENAETSIKAETPAAAAPTEVTAAEKETIEAMMARLNI